MTKISPLNSRLQINNRHDREPYQTKDTSLIREIAHPTNSAATQQSLAEATLPPGATTTAHFHPKAEEIYYVLSGQGLLRLEAEEAALRPGDAIVIAPGQRHQVRNIGAVDLVFLCCCAPAYAHDDTVLCESLFVS